MMIVLKKLKSTEDDSYICTVQYTTRITVFQVSRTAVYSSYYAVYWKISTRRKLEFFIVIYFTNNEKRVIFPTYRHTRSEGTYSSIHTSF